MAIIVAERNALKKALTVLAEGGLVAIATETVYGLAADATVEQTVSRLFAAKGRPVFNPLIAHVASLEMAESLAFFDSVSRRLAKIFWPGPLTLVLEKKIPSVIDKTATANLETIAIRMPRGFARTLIAHFGKPLVVPSANLSGKTSCVTAQAVNQDLGKRIDLIVDGGRTSLGLESSIILPGKDGLYLLRPGMITADQIEQETGIQVTRSVGSEEILSPGMMKSHYAPAARMRLNVTQVHKGEVFLAFGSAHIQGAEHAKAVFNLSEREDLLEAASRLFEYLRNADALNPCAIAVAPIPFHGYGEALNDRLIRAGAPREE